MEKPLFTCINLPVNSVASDASPEKRFLIQATISRAVIAGGLIVAVAPLSAQQSATSLSPVVVTATRTPQASVNLVSDIDAVRTANLRERGAVGFTDGLGMMSGIGLSSNGGPGSTSALFVRGASAGQTLTLVDGFRVSSVSLGQPTYEALPFLLSDRIEVLRGPGSAYYGADALGGVIQLFTPRPKTGRNLSGELAYGSESTLRAIGGISGGSARFSGSLRMSRESSDGYNATRPAYFGFNPDRDGYKRNGIVANATANLSPTASLRGVFMRNELDTDYDDGAFVGARTLTQTDLTGLSLDFLMDDQTLVELKAGSSTDRSESISSFPGVFESTQKQFSASARRALAEGVEMVFNYERLTQDVEAAAYAPSVAQTRKTDSYGVALTGRDGPHILQLSYRRDKSNQYDEQDNGSFTYGYVLSPGLRLGASYATGFRAPGFNDLYFPGYGRPTIRPEESRNKEVGLHLDQRTSANPMAWYGKLVYYNNSVSDLIVYAPVCPDPDPQFAFGCADNVNRANLSGFSLTLGRQHSAFSWRVNADFANPEDRTMGTTLPRRAKRQLRISMDYRWGQWKLGADLRGESSRFDDAANAVRLGGYGLLNLNVQRIVAPGWTGFLTASNVADRDYTTAAGFRPQGRLFMLGLRYQPS